MIDPLPHDREALLKALGIILYDRLITLRMADARKVEVAEKEEAFLRYLINLIEASA